MPAIVKNSNFPFKRDPIRICVQAADFCDRQTSLTELSQLTATWMFGRSQGTAQYSFLQHQDTQAAVALSKHPLRVRFWFLWLRMSFAADCEVEQLPLERSITYATR